MRSQHDGASFLIVYPGMVRNRPCVLREKSDKKPILHVFIPREKKGEQKT